MLRRAMNFADYLSIYNEITMNIFKFWIHLEKSLPPDSIAKLCLNISDKMAEENKSGLINKINLLCTQLMRGLRRFRNSQQAFAQGVKIPRPFAFTCAFLEVSHMAICGKRVYLFVEGRGSRVEGTMPRVIFFQFFYIENVLLLLLFN